MAARFAGDFFGIPLVNQEEKDSELMRPFPDLRSMGRSAQDSASEERSAQNTKAAPLFTGFKTFEAKGKGLQT